MDSCASAADRQNHGGGESCGAKTESCLALKVETQTVHKARNPSGRAANGYIHVAKPATASQIMRDLGISRARMKPRISRMARMGEDFCEGRVSPAG